MKNLVRYFFCLGLLCFPFWLQPILADQDSEALSEPKKGVIAHVPNNAQYNGCALLKEGPESKSKTIGNLPNGTSVTIGGMSGAWLQVTHPKQGWVAANLIDITETGPVDPNAPPSFETVVFNSKPEIRLKILEKTQEKSAAETSKGLPEQIPALEKYFQQEKKP